MNGFPVTEDFKQVGTLARREAASLIVGYSFDLRRNALNPETVPNPSAGREHIFRAWRLRDWPDDAVAMREATADSDEIEKSHVE